jgi:hypothetical protein
MRTAIFALLLAASVGSAGAQISRDPMIYLPFDEGQGFNVFDDTMPKDNKADCRLSGASCPKSGQPGKKGASVFFSASCPREYGAHVDECDYSGRQKIESNLAPGEKTDCFFSKAKLLEKRGKYVTQAATCGSAVRFNPVQISDGTVMMWYKEFAPGDGNPTQLLVPLANQGTQGSTKVGTDSTVARTALMDFGWDLSLVGGNGLALGRIGPAHWGGYWCDKWHLVRSQSTTGDSLKGWDHLAWHHVAFVFASGSTLVYVDGSMIGMIPNTGTCKKEVSFLGRRNVRYDEQGAAVRGVEWAGQSGEREMQNSAGALNNQLKVKEWSSNFFKGYMDEFKVYSYPLQAAEIQAAANA